MDMDADELFNETLAEATALVKQVRPDEFNFPTPDSDWNVHDLTSHMLYELLWVSEIVSGKTIDEVGDKYEGDLLKDGVSLAAEWEAAASKAELAVASADLDAPAHVSAGDETVGQYLREMGGELLIHTWDLGQAIGISMRFDEAIAQSIYDEVKDKTDAMQKSGFYGPPKDVPTDANIEIRLLAVFGRSPNIWREEQST